MKISDELLNKLIEDESFISWVYTEDDAKWSAWIEENPDKKEVVALAKRIILSMKFKSDTLSDTRIEYIKNRIEDNIILTGNWYQSDGSPWKQWVRRAAVIVFIATFTALLYFIFNKQVTKTPSKVFTQHAEKSTQKGLKLTTFLPDGSKIMLNSRSRFSYDFSENERFVTLDGEAFFEVEKDSERPFKVLSKGVITTALGTSFNINSKKEGKVEISLVSGKVTVENKMKESVTLHPGQMAIVMRSGEIGLSDYNYFRDIAWKDGVLVFNDDTFPEIFKKLEDWYGVNIEVHGHVQEDFHFIAKYNNQTLNDVLQGISFINHFEYSIEGDNVKIYFNSKKND